MNTLKCISEYVGAMFKHGGDIRSSITNHTKLVIAIPIFPPPIVDPAKVTPAEEVAKMVLKGELEEHIKRKSRTYMDRRQI